MSIRKATENAKKTMAGLSVTAQISLDMQSMMGNALGEGGFDRDNFKENFGKLDGLDLDELKTYAKAYGVSDFYYTLTLSLNGIDKFEAVSTTTDSGESALMSPEVALASNYNSNIKTIIKQKNAKEVKPTSFAFFIHFCYISLKTTPVLEGR